MKVFIITALAVIIGIGGSQATAEITPAAGFMGDVIEHGGGCRKSSPPGQCCHMERKTGVVHCH